MTRERPFPIAPGSPGDDETIVYRITPGGASVVIAGDTVHIGDDGIQVVASLSGNYGDQNAYTFIDNDGYDIGGLYARDDSGQNVIGLRAVDPPANGDDVLLQLVATADPTSVTTAAAQVQITADRVGESTDTYINLEKDNNSSEIDIITGGSGGRVRISPMLNLLGAALELCDIYIKSSYLIIKYNDAGTTRYKYLDLSGTGTSWTHSTSEP
ncbi:MAG: hypothetical protein R3293_28075 [Candidatus Promineifilaceae bacterium]|nr:hypothetical protein [Candidatus Promineifilaceae bacterium]